MKLKATSYSILGWILGLALFFLLLYLLKPIDAIKFGIAFVPLLLIIFVLIRISNNLLWKQINSSSNPRREFWNIFLDGSLPESDLEKIPQFTYLIDNFKDNYIFFDKKNTRKLRLAINKNGIRIQNYRGGFTTYTFEELIDIKLMTQILVTSDSNKPVFKLQIESKNGVDFCDLLEIDCPIDELEQILDKFKRDMKNNSLQHRV